MLLKIPKPGSPEDWLWRAGSDLALACISKPDGVLLEELCFHSQQAAEKSIKGILVYQRISFPKTHNIRTLLDLLPDHLSLPSEVEEAVILSDYAVSTRYPGIYELVDETEYEEAIRLAKRVFGWAEKIIK